MHLINDDYVLSFSEMLYNKLTHNHKDIIYPLGDREFKISDINYPNLSVYFEVWVASDKFIFELRNDNEYIMQMPNINDKYIPDYIKISRDFLSVFHQDADQRIKVKRLNK